MREYKRGEPPLSPETIMLQPGVGVYPIKEQNGSFLGHGREKEARDDDSVEKAVFELAELAQKAREVIEKQGGFFNGLIERDVVREDQEWMGSPVSIKVTYALAYKPPTE